MPDLTAACRDRDDAVFLHLAIARGAELLVSGDSDLTVLADAYPAASPEILRQLLSIEFGQACDPRRYPVAAPGRLGHHRAKREARMVKGVRNEFLRIANDLAHAIDTCEVECRNLLDLLEASGHPGAVEAVTGLRASLGRLDNRLHRYLAKRDEMALEEH
jgi:hypothetical protein